MKKIIMFLSAAALLFTAVSCEKEKKDNNFDNLTEDGFYVYGPATGFNELTADLLMAAGLNEATAENRDGMFEKYIVLEAGKDFNLVLNEAGITTNYGANLEVFDVTELADNPTLATVKRGQLVTGDNAPSMKVDETGLYHILLDLNKAQDLLYPQIVVSSVQWGVRGAMNSWGFTAFDDVEINKTTMTWKMENVEMPANGEFKFAYGNGWKIQLDDAGNVKANTNLGEDSVPNGSNIKVEKGGEYTIALTFTLKGGDISKGYSYALTLTKESNLPTELYMIGQDFGEWNWENDGVVTMVPVHSHPGAFWTTRYFTAANGFKFSPVKDWKGDFIELGNDSGYEKKDNNCFVEADGHYTVYVDLKNNMIAIEPAKVYGMGETFVGEWEEALADNLFTAAETKLVSPTLTNAGPIRMYTAAPEAIEGVEWWQMEYNVIDGKIVYRADGGDQPAVDGVAGQVVTLDFNAGTGSIK